MAQIPSTSHSENLSPAATAVSNMAHMSTNSLTSYTSSAPLRRMPPRTTTTRKKPTLLERFKNVLSVSRPKKKVKPRLTHKREGAHEGLPLNISSLEHSDDGVHPSFTPRLDLEAGRERRLRTESDFHRSQREWLTENRLTPPSPSSYDRPLPQPPPIYEDQDPIMGEPLPGYTASVADDESRMLPSLDVERPPELGWPSPSEGSPLELGWIRFRQSHPSPPSFSTSMGLPTHQ